MPSCSSLLALSLFTIIFFTSFISLVSADFAFLRYGQEFAIPDPLPTTLEDYIQRAREAAKDPSIARFFTMNGRKINSIEQMPSKAVALDFEEHFVWPFIADGYKHDVSGLTDIPNLELISLSNSPRVFEIRNFLTEAECQVIIRLATRKGLKASTVILMPGETQADYGDTRTSTGTFLDYYSHPTLRLIAKRAANLTAIPIHHSEDMQVIHYDPKTHYYAHHDWIGYEQTDERSRWSTIKAGYYDDNRFVTLVLYLNNVTAGGHTAFPYTNPEYDPAQQDAGDSICQESYPCLRVKPQIGNAAMFYNLEEKTHMMGDPDYRSMHAGCDPVAGADKWAANFWLHTWPWREQVELESDEQLRKLEGVWDWAEEMCMFGMVVEQWSDDCDDFILDEEMQETSEESSGDAYADDGKDDRIEEVEELVCEGDFCE